MNKEEMSLVRIYVHVQIRDMPIFRKLVIDEIGVKGFKRVENEAWKYPRNPKIFGLNKEEVKEE